MTPAKLLIAAAGPITTLPLVLFAAAVQRVPLSTIGILQLIAPTIQFLLGILVYKEPFNRQQLVGFALVWRRSSCSRRKESSFAHSNRRRSPMRASSRDTTVERVLGSVVSVKRIPTTVAGPRCDGEYGPLAARSVTWLKP